MAGAYTTSIAEQYPDYGPQSTENTLLNNISDFLVDLAGGDDNLLGMNNTNTITGKLIAMKVGTTKVIEGHAVTRWSTDSFEVAAWGKSRMNAEQAATTIIALNTDERGSRLYPVEYKGETRWVTVPD